MMPRETSDDDRRLGLVTNDNKFRAEGGWEGCLVSHTLRPEAGGSLTHSSINATIISPLRRQGWEASWGRNRSLQFKLPWNTKSYERKSVWKYSYDMMHINVGKEEQKISYLCAAKNHHQQPFKKVELRPTADKHTTNNRTDLRVHFTFLSYQLH